ncbi:MAG: LPS export ABC transporter permease LptG [Betaproteobacteria bacterium]|nr:LPS export ABC transporter permease LptG [Betaproteobacteria bacterium]MDH3436113.1 LPS export ABC transporter permease LptG [Betaproteobacteria bacterium]
MRTLRRYIATEIFVATALVTAALVMLFAFFDTVEQVKDLGRGAYTLRLIAGYVLLSAPGHVYELFPIAVLIGALFVLAQLVAGSEYTVMRTAGVSTTRFVTTLVGIGLVLAVITFVFGEFVGPPAERSAQRLRSQAITGVVAQEFRSGLWIKDDRSFINVVEVLPDTSLRGVRIYDFDGQYRLRSISFAHRGTYQSDRRWMLHDVERTNFDGKETSVQKLAQASWQSVLDPDLISVLLVKPEKMSASSLYSYTRHLKENHQRALRYEIALWNKLTYPLAVVVMVVLALPFAYFQGRQVGVGPKIFAGIMLGLVFHFLNRLFSYLGLINDWPAFASAVVPIVIFFSAAVGMIWWQERR